MEIHTTSEGQGWSVVRAGVSAWMLAVAGLAVLGCCGVERARNVEGLDLPEPSGVRGSVMSAGAVRTTDLHMHASMGAGLAAGVRNKKAGSRCGYGGASDARCSP